MIGTCERKSEPLYLVCTGGQSKASTSTAKELPQFGEIARKYHVGKMNKHNKRTKHKMLNVLLTLN